MSGGWLGKLKATLNPPLPPYFLLDDELDELNNELPALAKVLRAQQDQLRLLAKRQSSGLPLKTLAVSALLLAWLFRYEPMPTGALGAILDRWNGNIFVVNKDRWIDAQSYETKREE
jgi:hypothetical protein